MPCFFGVAKSVALVLAVGCTMNGDACCKSLRRGSGCLSLSVNPFLSPSLSLFLSCPSPSPAGGDWASGAAAAPSATRSPAPSLRPCPLLVSLSCRRRLGQVGAPSATLRRALCHRGMPEPSLPFPFPSCCGSGSAKWIAPNPKVRCIRILPVAIYYLLPSILIAKVTGCTNGPPLVQSNPILHAKSRPGSGRHIIAPWTVPC